MSSRVEEAYVLRASYAASGTQAREPLCGVAVGCERLAGSRIPSERRLQALHLVGAARGNRRRAAHQAEQLGRGQARPFADVCEEVAYREHGAAGEAHVLRDHGRMVVAAARQKGDQLRVGESGCIDGLQLPVRGDGGRLVLLVPVAKLLAPELLREDL